jgi:hypothetical protein
LNRSRSFIAALRNRARLLDRVDVVEREKMADEASAGNRYRLMRSPHVQR